MKLLKALLAAGALALAAALPAPAQTTAATVGVSPRITTFSSLTFSNVTTTNFGNAYNMKLFLPFAQGHRVSGMIAANSTASTNAAPWTNYFDLSLDGTNYSTTRPLSVVTTMTGTTNALTPFVFDFPACDGFQAIRWSGMSGIQGTSQVTFTLQMAVTP